MLNTHARTSWRALIWEREGEINVEEEEEEEEEGKKGDRICTVKPWSQSKLFHKIVKRKKKWEGEMRKKSEE